MKVITISGYAESGKDTVANQIKWQLQDMKFDTRIVIIHYADILKFICKQYFGWDGQKDNKGRELLQHVGTDIVRAKDENYWINFVVQIIDMFKDEWDYVLIPDCRFPNEADVIKSKFDSIAIRVVRPGYKNHLTEEQRHHASEISMDGYKFDYIINNPGTEGLEENVADFIRRRL